MGKSSKKKARQQGRAECDELLRQLNTLYGNDHLQRDVFGRRAALPSEIARQLQYAQIQSAP